MTPELLETLLIELIKTAGLVAIPYPQEPKDYFPVTDPGEVLVRYEGRKAIGGDIAGNYRKVKFFAEVVVVSRVIRGENGAYEWLRKIYDLLEGYTLDGATGQLAMDVESFMDEKDGLWQFGQKWSLETDIYVEWEDDYYGQPEPPSSFFPFVLA